MMMHQTIYVIISHSIRDNVDMVAEAFTDRNQAVKQLQHFREAFKGWNTFKLETTTLVTNDVNSPLV